MQNEMRKGSSKLASIRAEGIAGARQNAGNRSLASKNTLVENRPPAPIGSEAAYDTWIKSARTIPTGDVQRVHGNVRLAIGNATIGMKAVLGLPRERRDETPKIVFDRFADISAIGLALLFASSHAGQPDTSVDLSDKLKRARELRLLMLAAADALAAKKLLPPAEVARIHVGRGPFDTAQDCVDLAALFNANRKAIAGKHALDQSEIDAAAALGSELLISLKPRNARRAPRSPAALQATDDRDRLWTLLVQRHDELWRVGAFFFGPSMIDAVVPPLLARQGGRPASGSGQSEVPARKTGKQKRAEKKAALAARKAAAADKLAAQKKAAAEKAAARAAAMVAPRSARS